MPNLEFQIGLWIWPFLLNNIKIQFLHILVPYTEIDGQTAITAGGQLLIVAVQGAVHNFNEFQTLIVLQGISHNRNSDDLYCML